MRHPMQHNTATHSTARHGTAHKAHPVTCRTFGWGGAWVRRSSDRDREPSHAPATPGLPRPGAGVGWVHVQHSYATAQR